MSAFRRFIEAYGGAVSTSLPANALYLDAVAFYLDGLTITLS